MPKKTLYRRAKSSFNRNLKLLRMFREAVSRSIKGKSTQKFTNIVGSRIVSKRAKRLGFSRTRRLQVFRYLRKADNETKIEFMSKPVPHLKAWLKNKKMVEKQRRLARIFGEKL